MSILLRSTSPAGVTDGSAWHRIAMRASRPVTAALVALPLAGALLGAYVQVLESAVSRQADARRAAQADCLVAAHDGATGAGACVALMGSSGR